MRKREVFHRNVLAFVMAFPSDGFVLSEVYLTKEAQFFARQGKHGRHTKA